MNAPHDAECQCDRCRNFRAVYFPPVGHSPACACSRCCEYWTKRRELEASELPPVDSRGLEIPRDDAELEQSPIERSMLAKAKHIEQLEAESERFKGELQAYRSALFDAGEQCGKLAIELERERREHARARERVAELEGDVCPHPGCELASTHIGPHGKPAAAISAALAPSADDRERVRAMGLTLQIGEPLERSDACWLVEQLLRAWE